LNLTLFGKLASSRCKVKLSSRNVHAAVNACVPACNPYIFRRLQLITYDLTSSTVPLPLIITTMAERFFDQVADVGSDEEDEELDEETGEVSSRQKRKGANGANLDDSSDEEDEDDDEEALRKVWDMCS
jgi:hypothetical protein